MSSITTERRVYEAHPPSIGVMSAPLPPAAVPGLMSTSWRSGRGLMEPNPDLPPFEWRRDGVAFLWLLALILALVVWIGLLAQGTGQPRTTATDGLAANRQTFPRFVSSERRRTNTADVGERRMG